MDEIEKTQVMYFEMLPVEIIVMIINFMFPHVQAIGNLSVTCRCMHEIFLKEEHHLRDVWNKSHLNADMMACTRKGYSAMFATLMQCSTAGCKSEDLFVQCKIQYPFPDYYLVCSNHANEEYQGETCKAVECICTTLRSMGPLMRNQKVACTKLLFNSPREIIVATRANLGSDARCASCDSELSLSDQIHYHFFGGVYYLFCDTHKALPCIQTTDRKSFLKLLS